MPTLKAFASLAAVLAAASLAAAENMVFNAGFELGEASFEFARYLRPDANPKLEFLKPSIDESLPDSGARSLRIPNPYAEQCKLLVGEFKLAPGGEYYFSFAAKSDSPACDVNVCVTSPSPGAWDVKVESFRLERDWKTYGFKFKTKSPWKQPYYSFRIEFCRGKGQKPGDIWIESLMLCPASSQKSQWQPCADVEAYASFGRSSLAIPEGGSDAPLRITAVNNSAKRVKADLNVRLVEDLAGSLAENMDGAVEELAKLTVDLAPRELKKIDMDVRLKKYGAFRVDALAKADAKTATASDFLAVVSPLEHKPLDLDKDYCAGINFAGGGFREPPCWGELDLPSYLASTSQEDYIRMYSEMGIRLFRDWDYGRPAFSWRDIEPEEGKFDFRFADKTVDDAAKYGIKVLPVLGGVEFVVDEKTGRSGWPAWIEPECRELRDNGAWKNRVRIPPEAPWRNFIHAVAAHFKGRVTHYEIINEAAGYMNEDVYLELLKPAYEEIKAADPDAKVVGFCSTGDKGGNLIGFLGESFKKGGLAYADAISFHPYDSPNLGSVTPANKPIDSLKAMLEKANAKGKPLWMTELYYLTGEGVGGDKGLCRPQDAAQRFLADLGEGVSQSMPLCAHTVFKRMSSAHFYSGYTMTAARPSGAISIYNALSRLFEGAKPLAKFNWSGDTVCYAYEKDGVAKAAFWNFGGESGLKLKLLLDDSNAQLYDLFGNRLSFGSGTLTPGSAPFYIEAKPGTSKDAFLASLKAASVEARKPVEASFARLVPGDSGWQVAVSLRSFSAAPVRAKLGVNGKGIVGRAIVDVSLEPNQEASFKVPVKLETDGPTDAVVKVYADGKIWDFELKLAAPQKNYPAGRDKDGAAVERLNGGNASFSASYDGERLYLRFDVKDSIPSGFAQGKEPWEQDCIEIFIDLEPAKIPFRHQQAYTGKIARLFIMPYAPEGRRLVVWPQELEKLSVGSVDLKIVTRPGGYSTEIGVPLDSLRLSSTPKGESIGFEVCVDYADGVKRQSVESWSSGGDAYKDRLLFGFISFI